MEPQQTPLAEAKMKFVDVRGFESLAPCLQMQKAKSDAVKPDEKESREAESLTESGIVL